MSYIFLYYNISLYSAVARFWNDGAVLKLRRQNHAIFFAVREFLCCTINAHFSIMSNKRTNPELVGDELGKKKGRPAKIGYSISDAVKLVSSFHKKCSKFPIVNAIFLWF
jgi:hypothetical protein